MTSIIRAEYAACQELKKLENSSYNPGGCSVDFDKSLCWASAHIGQQMTRDCPFTFCTAIPGCEEIKDRYMVSRNCNSMGVWQDSNYTMCIKVVEEYAQCLQGFCRVCPDVLRDLVISVSLTLSFVSVILLVAAIVLFSIFDSIQCRRLSIHKNLATAFVFRFAVLAIWTIVQTTNVFQDCTRLTPLPLWDYEWICKAILWFVIYFNVASVMWMLIEGAFLYSRFTVFAMRHSDAPWSLYLACGWGVPFVVVTAWALVHQYISSQQTNSFCWLPYAQGLHLWILAGTMGSALIMNLIFLLMIVVILVQKLRTENSAESKKIWRTIKATLLLVPLLGISNIPLFYEPEHPSSVYMLGSAILQHSQGIFIAVLYCFLNSEIQGALKRQLSKVPFEFFKTRNRFETERTYVPEARNATKNGVPMEEMNKTKNIESGENTESQDQVSTGKQIYSVSTKS
ncbi:G_PROTEIN_RECEP_F2_4 domain-containing protein [Caenorhabditis elegans]|uniref:G_PROTEIN_RECEP_F2_4 domain-containing protein n=1 Tax=Caenorhabditis elegans TaxID=6239 RepID=G5EBF7_CAEEL|nr:G_PROTEIN_RECEP_F2_4 domain-containing protein [Caenorhabditis elegans]AAQ84886.1 secretin receptor-like protein SEB-3 [Caenorhabditis elegans]CAA20927.2 G_PROTEIN_RECEP_F2_4 domain-containing protein [Caenorhabditis elegans]|eukprot:NP_510496.1 SEcretin/class B GPCR [Caenorhabditis elegans]